MIKFALMVYVLHCTRLTYCLSAGGVKATIICHIQRR